MKNIFIKFSGFILLVCICISCTEVVDVNVPNAGPRLVVEASINWEKGTTGNNQTIKLSTSTAYFDSNPDAPVTGAIVTVIKDNDGTQFNFTDQNNALAISVKGMSAHSSEPESGVNAIAYLAEIFKNVELENNSDGQLIDFVNQLIGLDIHGKQFGEIAYEHDFMGPMTVAPTVIERDGNNLTLAVNARRPMGKEDDLLEQQINSALTQWQADNKVTLANVITTIGTPMLLDGAPHAQKLLDIFKHFTGDQDADFVSIGGGTNAKLFDNAVSFGPSMPGKRYTGHSEHEFITLEQLALNLRMYTAMMIELGNM